MKRYNRITEGEKIFHKLGDKVFSTTRKNTRFAFVTLDFATKKWYVYGWSSLDLLKCEKELDKSKDYKYDFIQRLKNPTPVVLARFGSDLESQMKQAELFINTSHIEPVNNGEDDPKYVKLRHQLEIAK